MMKEYLAIINRYEFAQFYRFGYIFISKSELLSFIDINSSETKKALIDHFSDTTPFEYDEEYLIINLTQDNDIDSQKKLFYIQDIKSIYPLSMQARLSIQDRIDKRIKLEEPIFESILPQIVSNIQNKETELAIKGLWSICGFTESYLEFQSQVGSDNIFKGIEYRKNGIPASKIVDGNLWSILLAYDRFEFYPNTTLGYFFDAGQIFGFSKNKPTFEGSKLYDFLKSQNKNCNAAELIKALENSETTKPFISQTFSKGLKFHIVAPLFLMLKDDFRNNDDVKYSKYLTSKNLDYLKSFNDEFKVVIILLGSFFGFKKIYDTYYDNLNLRFYKNYKPPVSKYELPAGEDVQEFTKIETSTKTISTVEVKEESVIELTQSETITTKIAIENPEIESTINSEDQNIKSGNSENKSDTQSHYQVIIFESLKNRKAIKLTDIADIIKEKTRGKGKKKSNDEIKKIIDNIEGIEYFKDKKSDMVRRKELTDSLFT